MSRSKKNARRKLKRQAAGEKKVPGNPQRSRVEAKPKRSSKRITPTSKKSRFSATVPNPEPTPSEPARRVSPNRSVSADNAKSPVFQSCSQGFPIVGLGASAGGLEALREFFSHVPETTGAAFVVVTHLAHDQVSILPEILQKECCLPVTRAINGMRLEPNHVYVNTPNHNIAVLNGNIQLMEVVASGTPPAPIDYFLRSLAEDQRERSICVILSGNGSDGTLGLKAIKGESGMAMAQELKEARFQGMPENAIATGLVDYVLPAAKMPQQIMNYVRGPYLREIAKPIESISPYMEMAQKVFVLIRERTGHDFSAYKPNTIRRRIERRMNVHHINRPERYVRFLQENPFEIEVLFRELLIGVTSFFRDPEAFDVLQRKALPELLRTRPNNHALRIWVPGCSSGEEAYSIAIVIRELLEERKKNLEVQIFGTDLDSQAIDLARAGHYPAGIAADLGAKRLKKFFLQDESGYRIRKEIREMLIFAPHNLIKDPPFTKLDMVSCRNVLIYLDGPMQRQLVPMFHYTLRRNGVLFLGASETVGSFMSEFEAVDRKWKVYVRRNIPSETTFLDFAENANATLTTKSPAESEPRSKKGEHLSTLVDRLLLREYVPAALLINDRGDIMHIHGRTGAYLEPASGQPRLNIFEMAREGLKLHLGTAIRACTSSENELTLENLSVRSNGGYQYVNLHVRRLSEPETLRGLLLVSFQESRENRPEGKSRSKKINVRPADVTRMERELQHTRENLQSTIEELKSSNEEVQSTNEELQSTNEELETSKEEMQSLNEELQTVNAELQSKVEDLVRLNSDMKNLLEGTDIATLFLDNNLCIKRFTTQAKSVIKLIDADVGRHIGDIVPKLNYDRLVSDAEKVVMDLAPREVEVQASDQTTYLMRLTPYRTMDNVIDGVVITFIDITRLKEAEIQLRRMHRCFMDAPEPFAMLELCHRVADVNHEMARILGQSRQDIIGRMFESLLPNEARPGVVEMLNRCRSAGPVRAEMDLGPGEGAKSVPVQMTFSALLNESGQPAEIVIFGRYADSAPGGGDGKALEAVS